MMRMPRPDPETLAKRLVPLLPAGWIGLKVAPCLGGNLLELMERFAAEMAEPFRIRWCPSSLRCLLLFLGAGLLLPFLLEQAKPNLREGSEHGSAVWGTPRELNAALRQERNIPLTKHISIGLDTHRHRRNLNILVIGGSGAGKSRSIVLPGVLEAASDGISLFITDPKSEILQATGECLRRMNYEIVVFDLLDFSRSDGYNPFRYIRDDKDVLKLIENLIRNTTPAGARSSDPFWEKAETALLEALMLYLIYEEPEEKQNFGEIMNLLGQAEIREDDESYKSSLDRLFGQLEPDHIAARQYGVFTKSAGRTAKSIIISVMVRLSAFNLPQVRSITEKDEMRFGELGEKKKAIFAVIPDNDASLSYLVGMMISQMVQELYYQADRRHGGKLPVHVRMLLDEYANLALPDSFDQALATMRSREISATVIVQNLAQLKTIHKDHRWESLVGNADTMVYLGGNELSTHEYISKMLGKETIDTRDHSETRGQHGSWSTQMHRAGRELLTPDEVRMLDNRYALVFIRGFRPVKDEKYDLLSHPNYAMTGEATGMPYVHREPERWKPFLENFDFAHADAYILYQEEEME